MAVMSDFVSDFGGVTRLPRKADQHDMPTESKVLHSSLEGFTT